MDKKNRFAFVAGIVFLVAFGSKAVETFNGIDLSSERYILVGIVLPLLIMMHFIYHLRNPDFYENKKEFAFLSTIYKYVFIPACILYIIGGILFT